MSFGERITKLRKQNGMTQEQLAEKIDVTRQTISKWELDQSTPDLNYICQISELFRVTTDYLIRGDEKTQNESENVDATTIIRKKEIQVPIRKWSIGMIVCGVLIILFGLNFVKNGEIIEGLSVVFIGIELAFIRKYPVAGMVCVGLSVVCMVIFLFVIPNTVSKITIHTESGLIVRHIENIINVGTITLVVNMIIVMIQGIVTGFMKSNVINIVLLVCEILSILYYIWAGYWYRTVEVDFIKSLLGVSIFFTISNYIHKREMRIGEER